MIKNIEKIKKLLPHGAQTEIAKRCGKTLYTVNRVLNGASKNVEVIRAINEYLNEYATISEQLEGYAQKSIED